MTTCESFLLVNKYKWLTSQMEGVCMVILQDIISQLIAFSGLPGKKKEEIKETKEEPNNTLSGENSKMGESCWQPTFRLVQ